MFVPDFACRCAMKAKEKNYTFFGMQFYGKRNCFIAYENCSVTGYKNSDLCYYYNNFTHKQIQMALKYNDVNSNKF